MPDIETRLKVFLQSDSTVRAKVGERIHFDEVPSDKKRPYIWARLSMTGTFPTLDMSAGQEPGEYLFDLECISPLKPEARQITESVRAKLEGYHSTFADTTVRGIFVTDQDENYEPKGIGESVGLFVGALGIQVFA